MANSKVPLITSVILVTLESFPPKLWVSVIGRAPTPGWGKTGYLSPYFYFVPPQDGIYEFEFIADSSPHEIVASEAETEIRASCIIDPIPAGLAGVKVYGESNYKTALYAESVTGSLVLLKGTGSSGGG
jgi:hypothetical protein